MSLLSPTETNTGRQLALDYARGFAVICMVLCHAVMHLGIGYDEDPLYFFADEILGGPSVAPLFMICLGISLCYSRHTSPLYLLKRGIKYLLGAYLLSFLRGGLLAIMGGMATGWDNNEVGVDYADMALKANMIVDILQFAGVMFLFLALALKLKLNNWMMLAAGILFQLVGHCFEAYDAGNGYATALWGLLIPSGDVDPDICLSCFPFTLWAIYPIIGYIFGQYLRRISDLDFFYKRAFIASGALTLLYFIILFIWGNRPFSPSYYWHTLPEAFFYLALDLFIISAFHLLIPRMPHFLHTIFVNYSYDITRVYCVSWCLILWIRIPIQVNYDMRGIEPLHAYPIAFVILIASFFIQKWAKRKKVKA